MAATIRLSRIEYAHAALRLYKWRHMSRVVLVSNRVLDLSKAARAGGVAVVLANIVRTRKAMWFGWNGEVTAADQTDVVEREGPIATAPLSEIEHARYYLGYANSVLWPVFHNRLDLAKFEAGFFEYYVATNRRLAALLHPLLRADDIIWIHDHHLIPFAGELRRRGVSNPIGFYLHIPFPPWQTFMAVPEHRELARMLTAYDLIGVQTQADVANLLDYMSNGVDGRIVPDGRVRVFERLVSIASFPVGIDMTDFAKAKRSASLAQARSPVSRIIGVDRLDYTKGLPQKFKAFGRLLDTCPQLPTPGRAHPNRTADAGECRGLFRYPPRAGDPRRLYQRPLGRPRLGANSLYLSLHTASPTRRRLSFLSGMHGNAAARRHEPDSEGVRGGPGYRRPRCPHPLEVCRRGRANDRGAHCQSLQHRRDG